MTDRQPSSARSGISVCGPLLCPSMIGAVGLAACHAVTSALADSTALTPEGREPYVRWRRRIDSLRPIELGGIELEPILDASTLSGSTKATVRLGRTLR
jgi:hypothetical protein